jgi:uncharacterized protein (TIGR00297 family)
MDMSPTAVRLAVAAGAAAIVALLAFRIGALSRSGAGAAALVGFAAMAAGWRWGVLLILYFVSSTALSRWRTDLKSRRAGAIVQKGGPRDASQVLANGGVFAAGAALSASGGDGFWAVAGLGALSASAADTWATEIGTLSDAAPRSVATWRRVPVGTSGGVTILGSVASVAGALFVAAAAALLGWPPATAVAALAGGIVGSLLDSVLGATVQLRRWCEACGMETEQSVHRCGTVTRYRRGLRWVENDAVNLLATIGGGAAAVLVYR